MRNTQQLSDWHNRKDPKAQRKRNRQQFDTVEDPHSRDDAGPMDREGLGFDPKIRTGLGKTSRKIRNIRIDPTPYSYPGFGHGEDASDFSG